MSCLIDQVGDIDTGPDLRFCGSLAQSLGEALQDIQHAPGYQSMRQALGADDRTSVTHSRECVPE